MRLGEWLKNYREMNNMTLQSMADLCGFSKSYAHMLEKGINPTTNRAVSPTMMTLQKIANATGQDFDSFLRALDDDQPITVQPPEFKMDDEEKKLLECYRGLDAEGKSLMMNLANKLKLVQKAAVLMM